MASPQIIYDARKRADAGFSLQVLVFRSLSGDDAGLFPPDCASPCLESATRVGAGDAVAGVGVLGLTVGTGVGTGAETLALSLGAVLFGITVLGVVLLDVVPLADSGVGVLPSGTGVVAATAGVDCSVACAFLIFSS